jgi:hypothetical protein
VNLTKTEVEVKRIQIEVDIYDLLYASMKNCEHSHLVDKDTVIDFKMGEKFEYFEDLQSHVYEILSAVEMDLEPDSEV